MEVLSSNKVVFEMLGAFENAQLVYVAAKLGIADHLHDGPRSSEDIATASGVNAFALRRVMRGLVNRGILREEIDGKFALTSTGECLKSDSEDDVRGIAINIGELLYGAWGELLYSVKTGKPAFERIHGMKWFEYLKKHPDHARIFDRGMAKDTAHTAAMLSQVYDFSNIRTIADIGGGQGILLSTLLQNNPHMNGILYDRDDVIASANLVDRCELVVGDFFENVPTGCDAYLLKSIIHDWDDEQAIRILKNCRAAMNNHARLLLVEPVMPERVNDFSLAVEMDLGMLLLLNGRERTAQEYKELLWSAGFELTEIIPVSEPFSVIEAKPITSC